MSSSSRLRLFNNLLGVLFQRETAKTCGPPIKTHLFPSHHTEDQVHNVGYLRRQTVSESYLTLLATFYPYNTLLIPSCMIFCSTSLSLYNSFVGLTSYHLFSLNLGRNYTRTRLAVGLLCPSPAPRLGVEVHKQELQH